MTVKRGLDETAALRSITGEAAKIAGIDGRAGSSESGKDADLAIWSRSYPPCIFCGSGWPALIFRFADITVRS